MRDPVDSYSLSSPTVFIEELLESDRRYFESAASVEDLSGATLTRMPGLRSLPAACVVHRITSSARNCSLRTWLDRLEARVASLGYSRMRIYLQDDPPALKALLRQRGYDSTSEIGFLKEPPQRLPSGACSFEPVSSAREWAAKLQLHQACPMGPDGYPAPAEAWVDLEYRKTEAGYMEPFLARHDGRVCGTVSVAPATNLLRLKNIVVHPDFRGDGVGTQLVHHVLREARARGYPVVGVFGVEGSPGAALYRSCGFEAVTTQVEWQRDLSCSEA